MSAFNDFIQPGTETGDAFLAWMNGFEGSENPTMANAFNLFVGGGGQTFDIAVDATEVAEGGTVTFTLTTTGVDAGTVIPFDIQDASPAGGGVITVDDFDPALNTLAPADPASPFTVGADGTAQVTLTIADDGTEEGAEAFNVFLQNGQAASDNVTITDGGGGGDTIVVPVGNAPQTVPGTDAADIFTFDAGAALVDVDGTNTQDTITGFEVAQDILRIDMAQADPAITTLDQLNGVQGVAVQPNPIAGTLLINFGNDDNGGEVVTITLDGVTDATAVAVEIV